MKTILTVSNELGTSNPVNLHDVFVCVDSNSDEQLGSGGGIINALETYKKSEKDIDKLLIINDGGKCNKLPAYMTVGKSQIPIPVFRWKTGQKINQTLFQLENSFYKKLVEKTNKSQSLVIASGDVLLECKSIPEKIPNTDIVIFTTWIDASIATEHGVVFVNRNIDSDIDFILHKPSLDKIESLLSSHYFMLDTGCWILSDKAQKLLMDKCLPVGEKYFDLYTFFGDRIGKNPLIYDKEISKLTCSFVNLENGNFYNFGTTRELLTSMNRIQNSVTDPREIYKKTVKAQPSIYVQNCDVSVDWTENMNNIWIENSTVGKGWKLDSDTVITGIPKNNWNIYIPKGICLDVLPVGHDSYCLHPYGIDDVFEGSLMNPKTKWMGKRIPEWIKKENIDIYDAKLFPVLNEKDFSINASRIISWMINYASSEDMSNEYFNYRRLSSSELIREVNISRLQEQRDIYLKENLKQLALNYKKSVFYQCDLKNMQALFNNFNLQLPEITGETDLLVKVRNSSFCGNREYAFEILREEIVSNISKVNPIYNLDTNQVIYGRSPVRIDLAGGWTDIYPYSVCNGGNVVNVAVDINGQQPIQVYLRRIEANCIILHSIDMGMTEVIETYDQFDKKNDIFSVQKKVLELCGFSNKYSSKTYDTLNERLREMGGGLDVTLFSSVPQESGLGTTAIMASTLMGTLNRACNLKFSKKDICFRVFILRHLLGYSGGWQDQYGSVFGGLKQCISRGGLQRDIQVRQIPNNVMVSDNKDCWLLYYTGIVRRSELVLEDIATDLFLNHGDILDVFERIKENSEYLVEAFQCCDYESVARCIKKAWEYNQLLNKTVSNEEIESIISKIEKYTLGYKMTGIGGGGYLLICAKDIASVRIIKEILNSDPVNDKARFYDISLNMEGFVISEN